MVIKPFALVLITFLIFLGLPTDESVAALITKYESDFFETVELNKISTDVLESSLIEIISIGLGAAFAGVVIDLLLDKSATMQMPSRAEENRSANNLRNYFSPLFARIK